MSPRRRASSRLDAVLVTHSDNDHYSVPTNRALARVTRAFHSTHYVDTLMRRDGLSSVGHRIGDVFNVGPVRVKVTLAGCTTLRFLGQRMAFRPGRRGPHRQCLSRRAATPASLGIGGRTQLHAIQRQSMDAVWSGEESEPHSCAGARRALHSYAAEEAVSRTSAGTTASGNCLSPQNSFEAIWTYDQI